MLALVLCVKETLELSWRRCGSAQLENVLLTVSLTFALFHTPSVFFFLSPTLSSSFSENMIMNLFLLLSTSLNSL